MKYLLMIYGTAAEDALEESDGPAWDRFNTLLRERGAWLGAEALERATSARTVNVRNGELLVTDGPFAETKEQLAGYYLVDCPGWDDALELASNVPSAANGTASIEVRPIWEFDAES